MCPRLEKQKNFGFREHEMLTRVRLNKMFLISALVAFMQISK